MDIQNLIESGGHIVLPVTMADLQRLVLFTIEQAKQELVSSIAESRSEVYYTPEQVVSLLNVCRRTLFRWNNSGYLATVKIGGLTRYRKSDIDRILDKG